MRLAVHSVYTVVRMWRGGAGEACTITTELREGAIFHTSTCVVKGNVLRDVFINDRIKRGCQRFAFRMTALL
ncbi:hypothetical protein E2C01_074890 [Portunus trituberculatus]|uniref:Uncharacterized protein n=1 Tax=Portunus trituberculatus TaxID=210409 RepID=A0A5B7IDG5_PORTR|nr:hypothetical protein [Portunus trituberculatus]